MEEPLIYPLPNRAWIDVNTDALCENAVELQRGTGLPLIPMIKADAYGVGAPGVVRALEPLEPLAYGVASVDEGAALRQMGVGRCVIVFTPVLAAEYGRAAAANLTLALGDVRSIEAWAGAGHSYHLAIDTGMNRAGIDWRMIDDVRSVVRHWPPSGAFTHFHSAEIADGSAELQLDRFLAAIDALGVQIPLLHADNSAAAARWIDDRERLGAIRPGIFLYGVGSTLGARARAVVSLYSRVVDLRWIEAGDAVSYDATYTAPRAMRIATASVGYGDGYPRSLSDRAIGIINGVRVPQRGLVTMDMTMFDVTDAPCEIGDVVTLIGGNDDSLSVEAVARSAGMSPYEVLTGLASRLERRYRREQS